MNVRLLRILPVLVLLALIAGGPGEASVTHAAQPAGAALPGDVDCDEDVTPLDALALMAASAGVPSDTGCALDNGDLTCDETADFEDAIVLLAGLAGLETGECGGGPPTTFENIDEAYESAQISEAEAMLYYTYAIHGDGRLPSQYQGHGLGGAEGVMNYIASRLDTLDPATRALIEPFLLPPFYANSWWAAQNGVSSAPAGLNVPPGPLLEGEWGSVGTLNGKVKVWYRLNSFAEHQKAQQVAQEIDFHIWPQLVDLMDREPLPDGGSVVPGRGEDDRLDIALVSGLEGTNMTNGFGPNWCDQTAVYMLLSTDTLDLPGDYAIVGHELFHAIQYSYDLEERTGGSIAGCPVDQYEWWAEASATWVMDYLYPDNQWEHQVADLYLHDTQLPISYRITAGPMSGYGAIRQYGAYVFPFYLARTYGPDVIRRAWEEMEHAGTFEAIDTALGGGTGASGSGAQGGVPVGLEEAWPDFAVKNWNREPVTDYQDWDDLDVKVETSNAVVEDKRFFFGDRGPILDYGALGAHDGLHDTEISGLFRMGMTYHRFVIDDAVRSLEFYNGIAYNYEEQSFDLGDAYGVDPDEPYVDPSERKGIRLWAIVKVNGEWQEPEDWTEQLGKGWCRDVASERVEEIVLIASNSNWRIEDPWFPKGNDPAFWATNVGCARWEGTITNTFADEDGHQTIRGEDLVFVRDPAQVSGLAPTYGVNYILESGNVSWEYDYHPGSCSLTGSGDHLPLPQYHTLQTTNVMSGAYYRVASGSINIEEPQTYTEVCPPDPPMNWDHYVSLSFPGEVTPENIGGSGGVIEGEYHQGGLTMTWHLEAVRE